MHNRKVLSILAALFLTTGSLSAEGPGPYVIRSVDFEVKGRTLPFVLRQLLEQDGPLAGRNFADLASLEAFIADKRQILINNRVLASAESSYELSETSDGMFEVALHYAVVDTWNIIALPEPKYDSNKGLTLYLKGRDYNFAGSMQTLDLDLSFVSDTASNKSFELSTSFDLPFQSLGAEWSLGLSEDLQYWTDGTLKSGSSASLTWNIGGLGFPANLCLTQGFYYNNDYPPSPNVLPDRFFLLDSVALSTSIPTGLDLGGLLGAVSYSPSLSLSQDWWPSTTLEDPGRNGLVVSFWNSLSAGRSNWMGNMRSGLSASLTSSQSFNTMTDTLTWDLSTSLSVNENWLDRKLGLAARLVFLDRPSGSSQGLGGYLRGVLDARASGVAMAAANLSVPIKLFDFPTHVFIKVNWLDFELQVQPFIDAALIIPDWSSRPSSKWLWTSGGLEFLVFPVRMRNFIVRALAGWDLQAVLKNRSLTAKASDGSKPYEIYFGTGLAY